MSASQTALKDNDYITPPESFIDPPLTPPPTDERACTQAARVIALFNHIKAGIHNRENPWLVFQLQRGEFDEIEHLLEQDKSLWGFVQDKIRYDYDARRYQLIVRMPSAVHELFLRDVEDVIRSELKAVGRGSDAAAIFAQSVRPYRSTFVYLPVDDASSRARSIHQPDASFQHKDAEFPGVIIEVSYSQKRKHLGRLAEDYLLDSDASVQVVVGLDIDYGRKRSQRATLSVWRTKIFHTAEGDELRVVQEIVDEAFRDDQGSPSPHPGLRLQLKDFVCNELATDGIDHHPHEIIISSEQLCQYLTAAEAIALQRNTRIRHSISGIKKRKRSTTPPEQIASDDEAIYVEQEERAANRMMQDDADYEHVSTESMSSG